nr:ciliary-associated calcium-binding coiled-coil protein 1 isoform X2 [Anser cygnoides]
MAEAAAEAGSPPGQEEDQDQDAVGGQKIINQTFLSLSQITALSEQNIEGVQKKLEEFLNFKQLKTSLKEAILLDYYTAGFWWAKEKNFSLVQLSGFMDLLNFLLENLRDKHMTLGDNIKELGKAMAGIGETDSERSGDMDVFSIEEAKAIIDYLNISLFKPYKLYEHLFHSPREELVISNKKPFHAPTEMEMTLILRSLPSQGGRRKPVRRCYLLKNNLTSSKYVIELAPPAVSPFPPSLEEGMPSESCASLIVLPIAAEVESKGPDQEGHLEESCPEAESLEAGAVAAFTVEDQKSAVGGIPNEIIGNLEVVQAVSHEFADFSRTQGAQIQEVQRLACQQRAGKNSHVIKTSSENWKLRPS